MQGLEDKQPSLEVESKGKSIVFGLFNDTFEKFLKAACFCITYISVVVEEKNGKLKVDVLRRLKLNV